MFVYIYIMYIEYICTNITSASTWGSRFSVPTPEHFCHPKALVHPEDCPLFSVTLIRPLWWSPEISDWIHLQHPHGYSHPYPSTTEVWESGVLLCWHRQPTWLQLLAALPSHRPFYPQAWPLPFHPSRPRLWSNGKNGWTSLSTSPLPNRRPGTHLSLRVASLACLTSKQLTPGKELGCRPAVKKNQKHGSPLHQSAPSDCDV